MKAIKVSLHRIYVPNTSGYLTEEERNAGKILSLEEYADRERSAIEHGEVGEMDLLDYEDSVVTVEVVETPDE